jgi:hypothetical protein
VAPGGGFKDFPLSDMKLKNIEIKASVSLKILESNAQGATLPFSVCN